VLAGLLLVASCGAEPAPGRSVLLITLDTTRADVLSCYGGPAGLTPTLDRLAAEGTLFEQARTVCPLTLPSHLSMLTGLYPLRHRVRDNSGRLSREGVRTLAELAAEEGYRTGAFVSSIVLDGDTGTARGFERYMQPGGDRATATSMVQLTAAESTGAALDWLRELRPEERYFAWIHYYDPHAPYTPPLTHRVRVQGPAERASYCGEVSYMDASIGALLDELEAAGLLADTLVVVAGDHGEALGDHGERTHGAYCYDATMRVPLIVWGADGAPAGERRTDAVSVVDVFPTIVEALGRAPVAGVDGVSLLGPPAPAERGVYFESHMGYREFGWSPLVGLSDGSGKYIHSPTPEYYEPVRDTDERENLIADRDAAAASARRRLGELAARPRLERDALPSRPERAAQLAALGYAGDAVSDWEAPPILAPSELPSASNQRDELVAFENGLRRYQAGDWEGAAALFEPVVRANPGHRAGAFQLALCRMRLGDHATARVALKGLLTEDPESPTLLVNVAICARAVGDAAEAERLLRQALVLVPGHPKAALELADLLGE
jgi:arylsulfatase A-like enzyme